MAELTVTAIVPSYGRPDSLLRCLEGLLQGERVPDEVIVVLRDGDRDSREAFARWQASWPTAAVQVTPVTEPGQIAALNAGLAAATGEVVTFPDDDCVPRRDWLRRLMAHYSDPDVTGAGGRDVVHHAPPQPAPAAALVVGRLTWYGRVIGNHHCDTPGGPRRVDHLKGVNMSFRRSLLPPFDRHIRGPHYNDTDISLSLRGGLVYDPEAIVDHYPASRADSPGGRDLRDPGLTRLDAHDWMYLVLKHQPWALKGLSAAYVLLVGTRLRPGCLTGLGLLLTGRPRAARAALPSLAGAAAGVATWLRVMVRP